MDAASKGQEAVVRLLLDRGANIEAKNEDGHFSLINAIASGHKEALRLLDNGANIEAKNRIGNTSLIMAAWNGHDRVVCLLLEKGAKIDATNLLGNNARDLAERYGAKTDGHKATLAILRSSGAKAQVIAKDGSGAITKATGK